MNDYVKIFFKRGALFSVLGPIIYAIIILILGSIGTINYEIWQKIVLGIFTSAILAFIAAGISVVYEIEKLPMLWATVIHSGVLYLDYIAIYLLNGWLASNWITVLIFTAAYVAGYLLVWLIIYFSIKTKIKSANKNLQS